MSEINSQNKFNWNKIVAGGTIAASIGLVAIGIITETTTSEPSQPYSEVIIGKMFRNGNPLTFEAGIILKCTEHARNNQSVAMRADLVTNEENNQPKGRVVSTEFSLPNSDCNQAKSIILHDTNTVNGAAGAIESNVASLATSLTGDGEYPAGKHFSSAISSAIKANVPVIHTSFGPNIGD